MDAVPGLFVADDEEEMSLKIRELCEDPALRDRLGFRARRAMLNNYSHWSVALRLEELIEGAQTEELVSV